MFRGTSGRGRALRALRWSRAIGSARATGDQPAARAAAGVEPFAQLYETYVDAIYGYCLTRLGDPADAEDLTAQVFVQALRAGPRYGDPHLRAWLFAIAHNLLANHWRARLTEAPLSDAIDLADPAPSPEARAIADDDAARLRQALHELPDDQRQVMALRLAGLTGPEIAEVMGRSHGAVKMLQLRAFHRLRERLGPDLTEQSNGD